MFTGLIQDIGEVTAIDKQGDWVVTIASQKLPLDKMALGASVACNGICLTVIDKAAGQFDVQVSMETLSKTTAVHWKVGTFINLEPALRMGDELGGHMVSGHVDGLARVIENKLRGDSAQITFEAPEALSRFIATKGSVTLDGISLTVNEVDKTRFSVNIIPHTQQMTTFKGLKAGDEVNLEIDMIARYVERMRTA
ncbi:MAG: riboflavin synthase [Alphaproteobacteria bacterium]